MINFIVGAVSFVLLVVASWCVGEGGEILGKKYDASIIGGLVIAWLNTGLTFACMYDRILILDRLINSSRNNFFHICFGGGSSEVRCGCSFWQLHWYAIPSTPVPISGFMSLIQLACSCMHRRLGCLPLDREQCTQIGIDIFTNRGIIVDSSVVIPILILSCCR